MPADTLPPPHVRVRAIVKLGGAAITDKAAYETLRPEVLAAATAHLQQLYTSLEGGLGLVCVHGAGSFGHHDAAGAGLVGGGDPRDPDKQRGIVRTRWGSCEDASSSVTTVRCRRPQPAHAGSCLPACLPSHATQPAHAMRLRRCRRSVCQLNGHVVSALVGAGVPAVSLSPCGLWTTRDRELPPPGAGPDAGLAAVTSLLAAGLVPVLHGDVVLDSVRGVTVLSGDAIISHLAAALRPDYVVFLTNVAGVFTADPAAPGAQLLQTIEVAANGAVRLPGGCQAAGSGGGDGAVALALGGASHDVTDGMAAKVAEAAAVVVDWWRAARPS